MNQKQAEVVEKLDRAYDDLSVRVTENERGQIRVEYYDQGALFIELIDRNGIGELL